MEDKKKKIIQDVEWIEISPLTKVGKKNEEIVCGECL